MKLRVELPEAVNRRLDSINRAINVLVVGVLLALMGVLFVAH
jgi:hypothetical protein